MRRAPDRTLMALFIAAQILSPALLFIPGAQQFRFTIRSLPYATSLLLLFYYAARPRLGRWPASVPLIVASLVVLLVNLPRRIAPLASSR